jgi:hypothetical protein
MSDGEKTVVGEVAEALERHGYRPRLRAELKLISLRKARELAASGTVPKTQQIAPKVLDDPNDAAMAELCRELFHALKLPLTEEMLRTEATFHADLAAAFPRIGSPDVPVLVALIGQAQARG